MNVLTNEVAIEIDYENILQDYLLLTKPIVFKNYQQRAIEIKKFRKSILPNGYIVFNNSIIYLLKKDIKLIDQDSKKLPIFEFRKMQKNLIANLLFQLLIEKLNFFHTIEEPYKLFYIVDHKRKNSIKTLAFEIDNENLLQASAIAFTKNTLKKTKKEIYIHNGKTLALCNNNENDEDVFSKGNYPGKKINIQYFSRQIKPYQASKSYFIALFLKDIKTHLSKYLSIELTSKEMQLYKHYRTGDKKKKSKELLEKLQKKILKLNIVNYTNLDIKNLKIQLSTILPESDVIESNSIKNDYQNLCIVHSKEYYKLNKIDDPYSKIKQQDHYSQLLIFKNKEIDSLILEVILKELLIKNDIKNKFISITDNFATIHKIYSIEIIKTKTTVYRLHKLIINKNKSIEYSVIENGDEFEKYINLYLESNTTNHQLETIIEDFENNINIIYKTNRYPVVDYEKIYNYFIEGEPNGAWNPARLKDSKKKGQKRKFDLVQSIHGVKFYIEDDFIGYYTVGVYIGTNNFSKTAPIRKVIALNGKLLISEIMSSLDEFFVKNKEFTVLPYYLKYLREYSNKIFCKA